MTHFFTQLAARALELAPIVQPRLTSIFASGGYSEAIDSRDAGSADPLAIASPTLLVNPDRITLPIAHAPRSAAAAIALPTANASAGLPKPNQPAPKLSSAAASDRPVADGGLVTEDQIVPAGDRAEPVTSEHEFPVSNQISQASSQISPTLKPLPQPNSPQSAAVTDLAEHVSPPILSDVVLPNAVIAIRSPSKPSRPLDRSASSQPLGQPSAPTAALAKSLFSLGRGTSDPVGVALEQGKADSAVVPLLSRRKGLGDEGNRLNSTPTPQRLPIQPIDRADKPFADISPVVVPHQTTMLLPSVTPRLERPASLIPKGSHWPEETAPPPPTIQVTIGRIEVRAVSAPAPTRPRTATPPVRLSLDDYLRSRSGDNR